MLDELKDSFDAKALAKLMTTTGPVCKCVYVPCENATSAASSSSSSASTSAEVAGKPEEISLDMTPKICAPALKLGGSATICASYVDIDVIVMKLREAPESMAMNSHKLPAPFHEIEFKGPILLLRMDEESQPKDFPLEEYLAYREKVAKNPPPAFKMEDQEFEANDEDEEEIEGEEGESEEDGDEEGDEDDDFWQSIVDRVTAVFTAQTGREPTETELKALLEKLNEGHEAELTANGEEFSDEEEEEEENMDAKKPAEAPATASPGSSSANTSNAPTTPAPVDLDSMIRTKLTATLKQHLGRDPTEEELQEVLEQLGDDQELQSSLVTAEKEISKAAPAPAPAPAAQEEAAGSAEVADMIRAKVTELLAKSLGRAPTEEEIEETMETLAQDQQFHSTLMAAGTPHQSSQVSKAEPVPAPAPASQEEAAGSAEVADMIRAKVTELLAKSLGRAPTEEEIEETMETLAQDQQFHSTLMAAGTPQSGAKRSREDKPTEEQTPAPSSKRQRTVGESPNDVTALK